MIKLYCSLIILCFGISILTTNDPVLNEASNNVIAVMLIPIYMPYRSIRYIVLHFNEIVNYFNNMLNNLLNDLYHCIKPLLMWIEKWGNLFLAFVSNLYRLLKNSIINLYEYIKPLIIYIKKCICINMNRIIQILNYLWTLFLEYIIYPIYDVLVYLSNHLYYLLSKMTIMIMTIVNIIYDKMLNQMNQICNLLINWLH